MSRLDWEALQARVVRTLYLTFSMLVACYGAAIASEPTDDWLQQSASRAHTEISLESERSVQLAQSVTLTSLLKETSDAAPSEPAFADSRDDAPQPEAESQRESDRGVRKIITTEPNVSFETLEPPGNEAARDNSERLKQADDLAADDLAADEADGAEADGAEVPVEVEAVEAAATTELKIPVRFGASYSTSHAGFDDIVGVGAFIPIEQSAGEDVTFFEGNVQLSDGNPNFNVSVGHRAYDVDDDVLHGGYLGVDSRTTDRTTYYQLAAGYEQIQDDWEFRINGYVPIGNQTSGAAGIVDDSRLQSSSTFQGNQLVLSTVGDRRLLSVQEDALGGLDLEVGMQLDEWNNGALRGFVGGYWLSGEESALGVRGRLLADFESNFNAGLSVQHDGIFGTSVGFGVSVSLPGTRFHDESEREFQDEHEVAIRLRDPVQRRPTVMVNERVDVQTVAINERAPLRNPEEEEDYRFLHVDLAQGVGAGDGSFETPFGAVEDAIALINSDATTFSDGNTVVYVNGDSAPTATIPSFSVPDSVSVLSQGPQQAIAGMSFIGFPDTATRLPFSATQNFNVSSSAPNANGITVTLPNSGDGVFPVITGGAGDLVALGNNSVLAGFDLQNATNHGVSAADVANVEIRNNRIENAGGSGIALSNVGGNAILFDNEINGSVQRGIFVENATAGQDVEVAIAGFDLSNNGTGMAFSAVSTAGSIFPSQRIIIGTSSSANTSSGTPRESAGGAALSNRIANSAGEGLIVSSTGNAVSSSASQEIRLSDTTVENSGGVGIRLTTTGGAHSQEMTIDNAQVAGSGSHGIEVINGSAASAFATAAVQEFVIRNSTIDGNGGNGIDVSLAALGAQELVVRNNQITNNTGDGIHSVAQNSGVQEWRTDDTNGDAGISENTISGNRGQAIHLEVKDIATLPIVSVTNNTLTGNNTGPDIAIISSSTPSSSAAACLILDENIAPLGIELTGADPLLTNNAASILVQNFSDLLADPNVTFFTDEITGGLTMSSAAFANEQNRCIP